MLLAARCSKTFTNFCFPLTTLIRLYKFLKNKTILDELMVKFTSLVNLTINSEFELFLLKLLKS